MRKTDCGPSFSLAFLSAPAMVSMALSQPIGSNFPLPRSPVLFQGTVIRSGAYRTSRWAKPRAQAGRFGPNRSSAVILITFPSCTYTLSGQRAPQSPEQVPPLALDHAGLGRVRDQFVAAARRAVELKFDAIELHGAHGYLLHEFLSPIANRRGDDYGGSLQNRMRFPLEVFDAVRAATPAGMPVWMRISATDWMPDGWDIDDAVVFSEALERHGCAAVHVSSGGISLQQRLVPEPGYQVPFARRVKALVSIPTIAVGLITEPAQAESIIAGGSADAIALARGILYDPRWPWHAAASLGASVWAPPQYLRCQPTGLKNLFELKSPA